MAADEDGEAMVVGVGWLVQVDDVFCCAVSIAESATAPSGSGKVGSDIPRTLCLSSRCSCRSSRRLISCIDLWLAMSAICCSCGVEGFGIEGEVGWW